MNGWEAVLLGFVQGMTEFLPVSSSGHLVLAKYFLGIEENGIAFEIFVHFGTLLAIVTVFKNDIVKIFKDTWFAVRSKNHHSEETHNAANGSTLLWLLIIGNIPGAIIGFYFRGTFENTFAYPDFVCGALIITGIILTISIFAKDKQQPLRVKQALMIGLAQVVAFFPGISRSGTTISAGLFLGIQPVDSARFSFLLAIPLILGVSLVKFFELLAAPPNMDQITTLIVGSISAYLSGLVAIKWLLGVLKKGRFSRFAYYCFAVGAGAFTIKAIYF
ncbi:MAG: undecaprenyl-diphosphate phosphatase [bacterium]